MRLRGWHSCTMTPGTWVLLAAALGHLARVDDARVDRGCDPAPNEGDEAAVFDFYGQWILDVQGGGEVGSGDRISSSGGVVLHHGANEIQVGLLRVAGPGTV